MTIDSHSVRSHIRTIATDNLNDQLAALQAARSDPSVSILASTTPGEGLTDLDSARLKQLIGKATQRLRQAANPQRVSAFQARIARAVSLARSGPPQSGLAIFVSEERTTVVALPFGPEDRVVVGPRFATRDLVYALQHFPIYRLLLIAPPAPRLMEGRGNHLMEITGWPSDLTSGTSSDEVLRSRLRAGRICQGRSPTRGRYRAALSAADGLLDQATSVSGELPLVVVGSPHLVEVFRVWSRHAHSLIGEVSGWYPQTTAYQLAKLAHPALEHWDARRTGEALEALTCAERDHSVAWGVHAAWDAVRLGVVQHLWVDRDYFVQARLGDNGLLLEPAGTPLGIGTIDDLIDRLIQMSDALGARVDILYRLAPTHPDAIAVQLPCLAHVPLGIPAPGHSPFKLGHHSRSPPSPTEHPLLPSPASVRASNSSGKAPPRSEGRPRFGVD